VEYQEPWYSGKTTRLESSLLNIESVIYVTQGGNFLYLNPTDKDIGDSGPCQVNINCSEGDEWQTQKRGVARMLMRIGSSYFWCTGSLINNTLQDGSPLFLTAEHCGRNASATDLMYWQFYFNLEMPGCSAFGFPPLNMMVGADQLALGPLLGGSDFQLLRLRQTPPPAWNLYWNGWNREDIPSNSGVGIHHPSGDVKKISTYTNQISSANPLVSGQQMANSSAWRVIWTETENGHGVVEGGSSGSPLFNEEGLIIGTLTGGSSACDNPTSPDYYGKLWYHWDKNGPNPEERLAGFLDPINANIQSLQGYDPYRQENPSPGFVTATLNSQQDAEITWYKPGSTPNPEGWYNYVNTYSHFSRSGPERVTEFDAVQLGLTYPITLTKIAHHFIEQQSTPWPNDKFRFRIYDSDGTTLLYLSPVLTAQSLEVVEHELAEPIVFNNFFYAGIRPVDASGHPSSLMKLVNYGQGHSFYGGAGTWTAHHGNNFEGSYSYLTSIFVEGDKNGEVQKITPYETLATQTDVETIPFDNYASGIFTKNTQPHSYNVYRNGNPIYETTGTEVMSYTDYSPAEGLSNYHVTATYDNGESDPSPRAYLLNVDPCEETINEFPYLQAFESSFSEECWLNFGDNSWQLENSLTVNGTTIEPALNEQFFAVQSSDAELSDKWLILPVANFENMEEPALRFMFNGIHFDDGPKLNVWLSINGESFKKVWDSNLHPAFSSGETDLQWINTTVNLKNAENKENVHIAFQYDGSGEGFFGIDKIELLGAADITYAVTITVNPENTGTASGAGTFLSGETVIVKASPNVGYYFWGWAQGSDLLSTSLEYAFTMPEGNVNLKASFVTDPTSVNHTESSVGAFEVFPNPTKDFLQIRFNENIKKASIVLYNTKAQLVSIIEPGDVFSGEEHRLSLGGLPQGVYFVQIRGVNTTEVLKFVISDH
jgi:hypothetical protein